MSNLVIPGEFYTINGVSKDGLNGKPELIEPAMYVHDETLSEGKFNVFAAIWEHGMLMRVKLPYDKFDIKGITVYPSDFLETKVLCFPKKQRAPSVQSFIDAAYELIRVRGPHVRTLENDAYEAAGCFGVHNITPARLRLIIDRCKRKEV